MGEGEWSRRVGDTHLRHCGKSQRSLCFCDSKRDPPHPQIHISQMIRHIKTQRTVHLPSLIPSKFPLFSVVLAFFVLVRALVEPIERAGQSVVASPSLLCRFEVLLSDASVVYHCGQPCSLRYVMICYIKVSKDCIRVMLGLRLFDKIRYDTLCQNK